MSKEIKIVHVAIVDGTYDQIKELANNLKQFKELNKLPYEFLVTNDMIKLRDARTIVEQLYMLIKKDDKKSNQLADKDIQVEAKSGVTA